MTKSFCFDFGVAFLRFLHSLVLTGLFISAAAAQEPTYGVKRVGAAIVISVASQAHDAGKGAMDWPFRFGEIDVVGAYPGSVGKIQKLVAAYQNQTGSAARLFELASKIERVLRDDGYALARVLVPPQVITRSSKPLIAIVDIKVAGIDSRQLDGPLGTFVAGRLSSLIDVRGLQTSAYLLALARLQNDLGVPLKLDPVPTAIPDRVQLRVIHPQKIVSGELSASQQWGTPVRRTTANAIVNLASPFGFGERLSLTASLSRRNETGAIEGPYYALGGTFQIPVSDTGIFVEASAIAAKEIRRIGMTPSARLGYEYFKSGFRLGWLTNFGDGFLTLKAGADFLRESQVATDFTLPASRTKTRETAVMARAGALIAGSLSPASSYELGIEASIGQAKSSLDFTPDISTPASFATGKNSGIIGKIEARGKLDYFVAPKTKLELSARAQYAFAGPLTQAEQIQLLQIVNSVPFSSETPSDDFGGVVRAEISHTIDWRNFSVSPYIFGSSGFVGNRNTTAANRKNTRGLSYGGGLRLTMPSRGQPGHQFDVLLEASRVETSSTLYRDQSIYVIRTAVRF